MPDPIVPCAPARLVVLASGTGSLLQSLLAAAVGDFPARVVAVGLDRDCRAAEIAADAGVPAFTVRLSDHPDRAAWAAALTTLSQRRPVCPKRIFYPSIAGVIQARFSRATGRSGWAWTRSGVCVCRPN